MRILIIILFMFLSADTITGQNKEEVIAYIEKKTYADKPRAECFVDVNKFDIEGAFLKDIETGLLYGVKNTHRTNEPHLTNIDPYERSKSLSAMSRKGPHYLISCQVTNFEFKEAASRDRGNYYFQGAIKGLDVVTGTVIFYKTIDIEGISKESKLSLKYNSSDVSKEIAKKIRETTRDALKSYFPIVNWVLEIEETKKDKAKLISADKLRHMKQSNPEKVFAYVVDKEIDINGSKIFTFEKIGEVKKPTKDNKEMNKIFYKVNKGEKKFLSYHNEGKTIFLTTLKLGD